MSVLFNFPKDISKIPWRPVKFEMTGNSYECKAQDISFENGIRFIFNESLKEYKDLGFNKKTGFFLTPPTTPDRILANKTAPDFSGPLEEILSPVCYISSPYNKIISIVKGTASDTNLGMLSATNRASFNDAGYPANFTARDCLKFTFVRDNTFVFEDAERDFVEIEIPQLAKEDDATNFIPSKYVLTWNQTVQDPDKYIVSFQPRRFPESYSQKFSYLLSKDGICLFKPNSRYRYIVQKQLNGTGFEMVKFTPTTSSILPVNSFLKFVSHEASSVDFNFIPPSHLTKYVVNKLDFQFELFPDRNYTQMPYLQNFLGIYPVENPKLYPKEAVYEVQITGLKNYQTPNYTYSFNSHYLENFQGLHRLYDKVFTGTNQLGGFENVYLGYTGGTTEIVFQNNQETYFNYPFSAPAMTVHDAGFIEEGAIASSHPFTSDRIYVKQTDYRTIIPEAPQPSSISAHSTLWFCAWLSGSTTGEKTWVDRFYNPAYYTAEQALSSQVLVYNHKVDPDKDYVYDVPSSLVLEPGVFYKYFHVGNDTSKDFIKFIDAKQSGNINTKILEVSSWKGPSIIDESGFNHNGLLFGDPGNAFKDTHLNLDGSTHVLFPSKSLLLEKYNFTTSMWVYADNWKEIEGHQIFGNFYDSGYGLINESALTAPMLTFVESTKGIIYDLNYRFKTRSSRDNTIYRREDEIIPTSIGQCIINRLSDFSTVILDVLNGILSKYDVEGRKLSNFNTEKTRYYGVTQVEVDDVGNFYLFIPRKRVVKKLDSSGYFLNNTKTNIKTQRIEIIRYSTLRYGRSSRTAIVEIYGNASCIDNNNNVWQSLGNNLYKTAFSKEADKLAVKPQMFASVGFVQQITCDSANNLWILHDQDSISKLSPEGKFTTTRIGKRHGLQEDPCLKTTDRFRYLNFLRTPESGSFGCEKYKFKDLAVLLDTRDAELMLFDTVNNNLLIKLDLSYMEGLETDFSLPNFGDFKFYADGDFTGYQHLRKFYSQSSGLSWNIKISDADDRAPETIRLIQDKNDLTPGWHHFAITFNSQNGEAKYYVDSVLTDSTAFTQGKVVFFDYRSSLVIGADSIKNSILNDIIDIQDAYKFVGKVANLKIYNKTLSNSDIEQIYFSSIYSDNRSPLTWNMYTGQRNYIEQIKYWYQMQLPGNKSNYFNIKIHNFKADESIKKIIERIIRKNVTTLAPAETTLYKIKWID
jgi:hypothetical protein